MPWNIFSDGVWFMLCDILLALYVPYNCVSFDIVLVNSCTCSVWWWTRL
jgi:hypothetical protein